MCFGGSSGQQPQPIVNQPKFQAQDAFAEVSTKVEDAPKDPAEEEKVAAGARTSGVPQVKNTGADFGSLKI